MDSAPQANDLETSDFSRLSHTQKLAAFLLILDADNAAGLMKQLDEQELKAVATEMAKFKTISQEMQREVLREFSPVAVEAASSITGGVERTQALLEKSVGAFRASDYISRVSPQRPTVAAMEQILEMDPRHIFNVLRHEQLQTIALVASFMPADKASELLSLLRPEQRELVVERLATLAPTSMEVVESVAEELQRKLSNNSAHALNHTGGVKIAADLLNAMPKDVADSILMSLKERNADLGDAVLKKMFTFDELQRLDPKTLQKVLQEVDMRQLAVALKPASDSLKKALLSCISKRAAENVREEIGLLGPQKLSQIEGAQMEIIEIVRRLESEGAISLDELRQRGGA